MGKTYLNSLNVRKFLGLCSQKLYLHVHKNSLGERFFGEKLKNSLCFADKFELFSSKLSYTEENLFRGAVCKKRFCNKMMNCWNCSQVEKKVSANVIENRFSKRHSGAKFFSKLLVHVGNFWNPSENISFACLRNVLYVFRRKFRAENEIYKKTQLQ